jgi:hypothetical protein
MKWNFIPILIFIGGCTIHTGPQDKITLSNVTELNDFSGIYKNAGDPDNYLSRIIWNWNHININGSTFEHNEINLIQVIPSQNSLVIKAISNDCVIFTKEYVLGKDFILNNGEIVLQNNMHVLFAPPSMIIGPYTDKKTLGLDTKGHGAYKNKAFTAGLAALVVPMAISATEEARFNKLGNTKEYGTCVNR